MLDKLAKLAFDLLPVPHLLENVDLEKLNPEILHIGDRLAVEDQQRAIEVLSAQPVRRQNNSCFGIGRIDLERGPGSSRRARVVVKPQKDSCLQGENGCIMIV